MSNRTTQIKQFIKAASRAKSDKELANLFDEFEEAHDNDLYSVAHTTAIYTGLTVKRLPYACMILDVLYDHFQGVIAGHTKVDNFFKLIK